MASPVQRGAYPTPRRDACDDPAMALSPEPHLTEVTRLITLAVAPVFLLTAIGTMINVLASRLGRIIDRTRNLEERVRGTTLSDEERNAELGILDRRMHLTYLAIGMSVVSALCVGLSIAIAFVDAFLSIDLAWLVGLLFLGAMVAFIAALLVFLREIFLAVSGQRSNLARRRS